MPVYFEGFNLQIGSTPNDVILQVSVPDLFDEPANLHIHPMEARKIRNAIQQALDRIAHDEPAPS